MKNLTEHLGQYARYHRDKRNLLTHYIGIPLIVVAIYSFISIPLLTLASVVITPALLLYLATSLFYFRLDLRFGLAMLLFNSLCLAIAYYISAQPFNSWLISAISLFAIGWILQFIGHYYEGKKPAFIDDAVGLIVGPLFIVAELGFELGLRKALQQDIENIAGKMH